MVNHESEKRKKCITHGLTLQPSVYVIPNKSSYIRFDNISWRFSTLRKALDICFKTYQVLNLSYQYENVNTWTFIQIYLYGIKTKYDIKTPSLTTFINMFSLR